MSVLERALMLERAAEDALCEAKSLPTSPMSALLVARAALVWRKCQVELAEAQVRVLSDNCKLVRDEIEQRDDGEPQCFISYHTWVLARTKCLRAQYVYNEALQHFMKLCRSTSTQLLQYSFLND